MQEKEDTVTGRWTNAGKREGSQETRNGQLGNAEGMSSGCSISGHLQFVPGYLVVGCRGRICLWLCNIFHTRYKMILALEKIQKSLLLYVSPSKNYSVLET